MSAMPKTESVRRPARWSGNGAGWREHLLLLGRFLRNPRAIGAIAPSSPSLARAMVAPMHLHDAERVVELGPGTGVLTAELVSRLGADARLLAIDQDACFIERLRQHWPDVDCVCASAAALHALARDRGLLPIDHIVSGLPFASLPRPVTLDILEAVARTLRPGGTFTTFQYVHAYRMRSAVIFRDDLSRRLGSSPTRTLVTRNVPPAYVLTWTSAPG
jgi:phospholipid N-methyltransferase